MKRAVGYIRVSTGHQAESGLSLETQTAKVRAMATVEGVELLDIITDAGESAKSIDRPGLQSLLEMVDAGTIQVVIIPKLDRLTRSVKDLGELLECFTRQGVTLVSVEDKLDTGTAAGRLVLNIMVSVSQWEREAIGERTKAVLSHKRANGRVYGVTPYGYDRDGDKLVVNSAEQAIIVRIRDWRELGYSLRDIADRLNSEGIPTKRGNQWAAQTVKNALEVVVGSEAEAA